MKRGGRLYLILGVVMMLGVVGFIFFYSASQKPNKAAANTVVQEADVIVAATDIKSYTILTEDSFKTQKVNKATITTDNVTNPVQLKGKIALTSVKAGDRLMTSQLGTPGVAFSLDKGKKGMAILLDQNSTMADMVADGDYLDVILSLKLPAGANALPTPVGGGASASDRPLVLGTPGTEYRATTKTIVQDIQVIKVLKSLAAAAAATPQANNSNNQQAPVAAPDGGLLIVEVTDQQAELIKFGRENGELTYVLRAKDDHDAETTSGVTTKQLIDQNGVPMP